MGSIFEQFGFKYLGPIDGHNIDMLMAAENMLNRLKGYINSCDYSKRQRSFTCGIRSYQISWRFT